MKLLNICLLIIVILPINIACMFRLPFSTRILLRSRIIQHRLYSKPSAENPNSPYSPYHELEKRIDELEKSQMSLLKYCKCCTETKNPILPVKHSNSSDPNFFIEEHNMLYGNRSHE